MRGANQTAKELFDGLLSPNWRVHAKRLNKLAEGYLKNPEFDSDEFHAYVLEEWLTDRCRKFGNKLSNTQSAILRTLAYGDNDASGLPSQEQEIVAFIRMSLG